ncbi:MAG: DUF4215 domain-containing protein [Nannocystaceae bacterium]
MHCVIPPLRVLGLGLLAIGAACFQVPDIDDTDGGSSGTMTGSVTGEPATDTGPEPSTSTTDTGTGVVDSSSDDGGAACGDGMLAGMEECDDGNSDDRDGCSAACTEEAGFTCVGQPSVCTASCGDGIVASTEACDDGNSEDDDGCTRCAIDPGYECTGARPSSCAPVCGDSMIVGGEGCDDGDVQDGDGCSAQCEVELYYRCFGQGPGSCNPIRIEYVVADVDDAMFRASVAGITGGVVDYFDAAAATPTAAGLQSDYDCVFTHPQQIYADGMGLGAALTSFVDAGGNVVLGIAVDVPVLGLSGSAIMAPGYSPVTTADSVTFLPSGVQYSGNGTSVIHDGIVAYGVGVIDTSVTLQGGSISDATYDNGEISVAYRPDFKVVYVNGTGAAIVNPTGDWARLVANACAAGFVQ